MVTRRSLLLLVVTLASCSRGTDDSPPPPVRVPSGTARTAVAPAPPPGEGDAQDALLRGHRIDLGVAGVYNVFVCGSYRGLPDAQGGVAVAGDLTTSSFSIGALDPGGPVVVAGGAVDLSDGTVLGDLHAGGPVSLTRVHLAGVLREGTPFDLAATCARLVALSQDLSLVASTAATVVTPWGAVRFVGADPTLNVFSVDGADLGEASSLELDVPAGASVLVNVTGASVTLRALGVTGFDPRRTLWNLPAATSLTLAQLGMMGTVLAPRATTRFDNGHLAGLLVSGPLEGNGEAHLQPLVPFDVETCDDDPQPTSCQWSYSVGRAGCFGHYRFEVTTHGSRTDDWTVALSPVGQLEVEAVWVRDIGWSGVWSVDPAGTLHVSSSGAGALFPGRPFAVGMTATGASLTFSVAVNGVACSRE